MKDFFTLPRPSYTFEIFPPKGSADLAGTYATVDFAYIAQPVPYHKTYLGYKRLNSETEKSKP